MDNSENTKSVGRIIDDTNCDDESEIDEFFFESDHLALRGNADYRSVLRTIVVLEAQLIEAAKHIDAITETSKAALADPDTFIKKLASGESFDLPGRINIQSLPKIKFEKYNVAVPPAVNNVSDIDTKTKDDSDLTVRGRLFDQSKPETFNQLWTCEEQRRLEELLIEYPPEPIEMRRFAKIAKALGNRTSRQVASRLQKYFQKLHAAGLPVPGRIPRNARSYVSNRKNRIMKQMIRPTTFFPSNYVPVNITDDDENKVNTLDPNYYRNGCMDAENSDEVGGMMIVEDISDTETGDKLTDTQKMLNLIKRVKRDKEKRYPIEISTSDHNGFKCDFCNEEPITGTRWHCNTCANDSVDYCSDCLVAQAQTKTHHSFDHQFVGYRITTDFRPQMDDESGNEEEDDSRYDDNFDDNTFDNTFDKDYLPMNSETKTNQSYNYLDPNFLPE